MATSGNNLSDYNANEIPSGAGMRIGIAVAEWNPDITTRLLEGCKATLLKHGVVESNIRILHVPGSFELPIGAQWLLMTRRIDGVVCLGSVIQGETKHFDLVCEACAQGIKDVSLQHNRPVIFGVLTDNTKEQALDRSGGKHGNKGDEAAVSVIKMVAAQQMFEGE